MRTRFCFVPNRAHLKTYQFADPKCNQNDNILRNRRVRIVKSKSFIEENEPLHDEIKHCIQGVKVYQ